jgi:hypothetical protein
MEILIRSVALAAGVHVPPEIRIVPPRPRRRPLLRPALGRALLWLGEAASRAGRRLAAGANQRLAPPRAACRT